jgi:hypothetical protein
MPLPPVGQMTLRTDPDTKVISALGSPTRIQERLAGASIVVSELHIGAGEHESRRAVGLPW